MRKRLFYPAFCAVVLSLYASAELYGWAGGGKRRPAIPQEELRHSSPGSWTYAYWYHAYRGK